MSFYFELGQESHESSTMSLTSALHTQLQQTPKEIKFVKENKKTHTTHTHTGIIIPLFRSSSKTISLSSQKDQTWGKKN